MNGEWGFPMDASVMFLTARRTWTRRVLVRCGLPAEVQDRYLMSSTDGALESARIHLPARALVQRPDRVADGPSGVRR
mgnify:CR=1 FL=1